MKISIVTATYNSAETISATLESILNQTWKQLELIIVDGGSTDDTLKHVESFAFTKIKVISEPDEGIYDAMNKGIEVASGDVVSILNSDDLYADSNVLEHVVNAFEEHGCDLVYGDISFFKNDPSITERLWIAGEQKSFRKTWHPPHPGLFVRRSVYEKYGSFDTSFKLAGDFEFMLRVFHRYQLRSVYTPRVMVNMQLGGASTSSVNSILDGMKEISRAFQVNGEKAPKFYFLRRYLSKLLQFKAFKKSV